MLLRDVVRVLPSGAPISAGTEVKIYRESDNALIGTVVTDPNGMFEYSVPGNPGVVRYETTVGAGSKVHSTRSILPVSDLDLSGLRPLLSTFLDGVVVNYRDALEVESDGLSMQVSVGSGVATARGVIYRQDNPQVVEIPQAVTNPRIDVIAIRFWLDESGDNVGRCELVRKEGNEAMTPAAPTLTQSTSIWETPLAEVRVDVGAMGIAIDKVTDTRLISLPLIPDGTITKSQLAPDVAFGVPYVKNGHTTVVLEGADRLNFDKGFTIGVHNQIATQAEINLKFPEANEVNGTSNEPARKDHTHNMPVIGVYHIPARTISATITNQTPRPITLPPVKCMCRVSLELRVSSTTGGPTNGHLYVKFSETAGAKIPIQADAGVDSTITAKMGYETSGGTSATIQWGWDHENGTLSVTGGWLEWACFPVR